MTEWDATRYARLSALQQAMAAEVLALLELSGDERVLDVGCGNGRVTAEIATRLEKGLVVGIDPSAEMIDFASEHFGSSAHSNLRFETGDARRIPFRDEFDLVVSLNALHWIPDQGRALETIRAAMKPSGRAQLRLVPKGRRKSLEDVLEETRKSSRWAAYFFEFHDPYLHLTPEEYASLAQENALRVLSIQTADKSWDFGSRESFAAFGSVTFVEWTRVLPESERGAFVEDVLDRYRTVANEKTGEENIFKFYQMDVRLARG
jgi:trans-aconitate 2-methyltransferase